MYSPKQQSAPLTSKIYISINVPIRAATIIWMIIQSISPECKMQTVHPLWKFFSFSSDWESKQGPFLSLLNLIFQNVPFRGGAAMDYFHYWLMKDRSDRLQHDDTRHHKHRLTLDCLHSPTSSQNIHLIIKNFKKLVITGYLPYRLKVQYAFFGGGSNQKSKQTLLVFMTDKLTLKDNTISYRFTLFIFGGPCHLF